MSYLGLISGARAGLTYWLREEGTAPQLLEAAEALAGEMEVLAEPVLTGQPVAVTATPPEHTSDATSGAETTVGGWCTPNVVTGGLKLALLAVRASPPSSDSAAVASAVVTLTVPRLRPGADGLQGREVLPPVANTLYSYSSPVSGGIDSKQDGTTDDASSRKLVVMPADHGFSFAAPMPESGVSTRAYTVSFDLVEGAAVEPLSCELFTPSKGQSEGTKAPFQHEEL